MWQIVDLYQNVLFAYPTTSFSGRYNNGCTFLNSETEIESVCICCSWWFSDDDSSVRIGADTHYCNYSSHSLVLLLWTSQKVSITSLLTRRYITSGSYGVSASE